MLQGREAGQHWAIEKPKLKATRQLRRINDIPPDDPDFDDIITNANTNLEFRMDPAMFCIAETKDPPASQEMSVCLKREESSQHD